MRLFDCRKKVRRTVSGGPAGRVPNHQDLGPVGETGADVRTKPVRPSAEGSDNMFVTNSEVESAMNHRRCRAVLRDPNVGVERHLWDHKNPYYGCRGAGLQEEQDQ